jgi:hypothetical protein
MRAQAIYTLEQALPGYIVDAGLLTDELEDGQTGASPGLKQSISNVQSLDNRRLPSLGFGQENPKDGNSYPLLQNVRGHINQALGALAAYDTAAADTATANTLRGELYALQGYSEILLADLFCSGVPLSTLDFQQDFTYYAGSTTAQVYQDAVAKEDSALALLGQASTSDTVLNLARVVRSRALLALGRYAEAARGVAAVADDFSYRLAVQWMTPSPGDRFLFAGTTVSDREGGNGVPFLSSGDPRTAVIVLEQPCLGCFPPIFIPQTFPAKYSQTGFSAFPVADGIEARLIQAEAQLQPATAPSGPWLTTLNHLRASAGLSDTTDPGTAQGRIALLFQERAYWLFATGHRQGDLRRLLRQYHQWYGSQNRVYPTGAYLAPGADMYGTDVNVPIPGAEYANPLFHGCLDRGA